MAVTVKINVASTAASTLNWNGKGAKGLKKVDGTDITNLKANGVYTFRYDGTNFIVQGEGGEYGTATAGDVRSTKNIGTDTGIVTGTLVTQATTPIFVTPGTSDEVMPAGIYDGALTLKGDANLVASKIPVGTTIFGVAGALALGKKYASGGLGTISAGTNINVSGLAFTPSIVIVKFVVGTGNITEFITRSGSVLSPALDGTGSFINVDNSGTYVGGNVRTAEGSITGNTFTTSLYSSYARSSCNWYAYE
ncbi:hypothetical protein D3C86_1278590 [compost metagenome]